MPADPSPSSTPLWPHQKGAVDCIRKYLAAAKNTTGLGSALIHMPTGTGKTGVIACASHFLANVGSVLVLSPRVALRDQLAKEISGRFFEKLGLTNKLPKITLNLTTALPTTHTLNPTKTIFISTIQLLHSLARKNSPTYKLLQKHIDLVIVDEGHYEPAITWREVIRSFNCPKVLFTATPFRNDLKVFDVNFKHSFSYSFHDAVQDRTIRGIKVHTRTRQPTPKHFVADVIKFYDATFPTAKKLPEPPRVIIRCDSDATIRQIGAELKAHGRTHVLIHENFKNGTPGQPEIHQTVPDPVTNPAVFWVHQFKLLEGIDDPRFQVIALFEELGNTRGLVQQVGRVIRNPSRKANSFGHFLDHSGGRQAELWGDFLEFDKILKKDGIEIADFGSKVLKAIRDAQPDIVYLDGRFRSRLAIDAINPATELLLPQTVNVLRKPAKFNLNDTCTEIKAEFESYDRDVRQFSIDADTVVFMYLDFRNSPLLRSKCFVECRLGVTIIRQAGHYVCAYDSMGGVPTPVAATCEQVNLKDLRKLFPENKQTYLTAVSLHNSHLGARAIRSRSIAASRIDDTVPMFDDHAFICRTAQGTSFSKGTSTRRYVGFGSGKVTDSSVGRVEFDQYVAWLDQIASILKSPATSSPSFARFARDADIPADPTPQNVMLDVREIQEAFVSGGGSGARLLLDDACCDVTSNSFTITANGKSYNGTIDFQPKSKRYYLNIADIDADFSTTDPDLRTGIVRYLNHEQSFRVIPKTVGSFFTLGAFYSPIMQFGPKYDDNQSGLLKTLHPFACLSAIGSEKGGTCKANGAGWDPQSLFSIVDLLGVGHGLDAEFGKPDFVICDDLGTEAADFILGYTAERRVVFVHCKGKGNSGGHGEYSASGLQDVCGQATKNLKYFARFGSDVPPNAKDWHSKNWSGAKGVTGSVKRRIRRCPTGNTSKTVWTELQTIIRDPYADLQVWLFLGRMLKKGEFEKQLTKANPAAEAQQAAYLLFSTITDCGAIGASLKVFCSP